jgi:4-carboxymuconolactone decarboxylase
MDQKRYEIGLAKRRKVLGDAYVDRALQNVDDFNRDFQRILTEYCWGETWGDETLAPRERSILNLGMIAALGKMEEFATHVRGALNNGLTLNEIRAADADPDLLRRADRRRLLPRGAADYRRAPESQIVRRCSISAQPRQQ